jgi:hypothetical protein
MTTRLDRIERYQAYAASLELLDSAVISDIAALIRVARACLNTHSNCAICVQPIDQHMWGCPLTRLLEEV